MTTFARSLTLAVALFLALAAGVVGGFLFGRRSRGARIESAPVVEAVRKISKLATVEMHVSDVVRYQEIKTIMLFDLPKDATLRVRGTVLGGFDLANGLSVTADEATRTLTVRLPPPQILSVDARMEFFDEHSGWLNRITPEDRNRWMGWARASLGRSAKDAGLYERATLHARELFGDTAAAFGWKVFVTVGSGAVSRDPRERQALPASPTA